MDTSHDLLHDARSDPRSEAWNRFVRMYTPLIARWLVRFSVAPSDIPDLTQDVLLTAANDLKNFKHNGRTGAFRSWLRSVTLHRCRRHWRNRRSFSPTAEVEYERLEELSDPNSDLSIQWEEEHDAFVLRGLLEAMEREFDEQTLHAFFQLTILERAPEEVAKGLGWTIGKVYKAKFRVMQRLRQCAGKYLLD